MAARVYDIYDLNSPFVTPTAQTTAAAPRATTPRTAERVLRGCIYLAVFAGLLLLAALIVMVTPLGRIDADITVPFVAVCVGALGVGAWWVLR